MLRDLIVVCIIALGPLILLWMKRRRGHREMEQHTVTPEALHALMASNQQILVFDIRLPLDLLADAEIISGARRISPEEVLKNPSVIPQDKEAVVYLTSPDDKTSRAILRRTLAMHFFHVKFLKGGLEAWKAKGYPVEPYRESFHLYTPSLADFSVKRPL